MSSHHILTFRAVNLDWWDLLECVSWTEVLISPPSVSVGDPSPDSLLQGPSWAAAAASCLLTPLPPLLPVLGQTRLKPPLPCPTPHLCWPLKLTLSSVLSCWPHVHTLFWREIVDLSPLQWLATSEALHFYQFCRLQHDLDVEPVLLHKPGSQASSRLEARGRGGKMGRKGCGCVGKKAEEKERCHGGPRKSTKLPGAAQQVCYHSTVIGWPTTGLPQERFASCHLLPSVALARPPVPPWAQAPGGVRVPIWLQTEGGLHQPLSLQASGESR